MVFQVAYLSYVPALVGREDLVEANAKLQGSNAVAQVVGPGVGGLLVQAFRAPYALIVDAASYVVSAFALVSIRQREPQRARTVHRSLRREIAEGMRYVAGDPMLRVLTIAPALGNFFFIGLRGDRRPVPGPRRAPRAGDASDCWSAWSVSARSWVRRSPARSGAGSARRARCG